MSDAENVRKFLKELRTNPRARNLVKNFRAPASDEEAAAGYVRLAEALGYSIPPEKMKAGLQALEEEVRSRSTGVENAVGRIGEEELEDVSGGSSGAWYPMYCQEQFVENEWCWYADSCSGVINNYTEILEET